MTIKEVRARGWDSVDFVYVIGDSYVDHPAFGAAIISRVLESAGFRVAILSQPDWRADRDFTQFGKPRLGFFVSAGNIDSMVAHYTVAKRKLSDDAYTACGKAGKPIRKSLPAVGRPHGRCVFGWSDDNWHSGISVPPSANITEQARHFQRISLPCDRYRLSRFLLKSRAHRTCP